MICHELGSLKVLGNASGFRLIKTIRLLFIVMVLSVTVIFIQLYPGDLDSVLTIDRKGSSSTAFNGGNPVYSFHEDWCFLQGWRFNWESIVKSCTGQMSWEKRDVYSNLRTDAHESFIHKMDLRPAGEFSRIWIQSVDVRGQHKQFGGDSWRVYIRQGPSSVAPVVKDHNNGLYEVVMLIIEPGSYKAHIRLDYTLCDGIREPPALWFINGTDHGTYLAPKDGILGNIERDYVNSLLTNQSHHKFNIMTAADNEINLVKYPKCPSMFPCTLLWDGFGYWKRNQWFPYNQHKDELVSDPDIPLKRSGTLWVYGDSLGMRFTQSIQSHALCTKIFEKCVYTYNWIYEVKDKRHPLKVRADFNKSIILAKIAHILQREDMSHPSSAFLFSFGVHFPISLTFEAYEDLIDSVITLLNKRDEFKGLLIWKGTAAIEKEKIIRRPWPSRPLNYTMFRFLTAQRNKLFHTYSMNAMCRAGIPVLDVYPLTAAYHKGSLDFVHYNNTVFYPAEKALERFINAKRRQLNSYHGTIQNIS